jgi:hypothetical protein
MDLEQLLREYFWAMALGALAAFFYLAIVSSSILRSRALVELCRSVVRLREKHEQLKKTGQEAAELAHLQKFEMALREILRREGLRPAAPPAPPRPAPSAPRPLPARKPA